MTHTSKTVSPLRHRLLEVLTVRKLAPQTQSAYLRAVIKFTRFLSRAPDTATPEDLRRYQLHLVETGTSSIMLNATITALRFFFAVTLDRPEVLDKMSSVREPRKLPVVLSPEEVARLIEAAGTPKYQAVLSVAYGSGLRAGEVVALKVGDREYSFLVSFFPYFNMLAKKTSKNQITLPKAIISHFPDTEYFDVREEDGHIVLVPMRPSRADEVRDKLAQLGLAEADVADAIQWARQS